MKKVYLSIYIVFISVAAFAQKLPDVQNTNVLAPAGIKIDGKLTDWTNPISAENKRTNLNYTLANDEKNLYLVIQTDDKPCINKIMLGGISLTVNTEGKKKDKDAFVVTYPLIKRASRGQGGGRGFGGGGFGGGQNRTEMTTAQRDSISLALHKTQLATAKEIKVAGFKDIQDSLISIYNVYGIKVVSEVDDKGTFIYEMAVPLKLLGLNAADSKEFAYQIKLNGLTQSSFGGGNGGGGFSGGGGRGGNGGGGGNRGGGFGGGSNNYQDLMMPTDFWAKYTLAKK